MRRTKIKDNNTKGEEKGGGRGRTEKKERSKSNYLNM